MFVVLRSYCFVEVVAVVMALAVSVEDSLFQIHLGCCCFPYVVCFAMKDNVCEGSKSLSRY